jgi:hypothetical protein
MSNITWIFFLIIIIVLVNIHCYKENFEEKKEYDIIISINVHEKFQFLLKQLNNIKENVLCNYAVILNCNDYMFQECKNNILLLPDNVYIYDKPLNKKHSHGSLTNGIFNNIEYAIINFDFKYFIVSSSRNFFANNLTLEDLNKLKEKDLFKSVETYKIEYKDWEEKKNTWHWPSFSNTLLVKYFLNKKQCMYSSPHEGVIYTYNGCNKITKFLNENPDIKDDLFNFNDCVEEFSLQTISANFGEPFYYIGNGCCNEGAINTNGPESEILKFMYKTKRDGFLNKDTYLSCSNY